MKIVLATPLYPPEIGGPAKYAKALHDEFTARGIDAPVVGYGAPERALPAGLRHLAYFFRILPSLRGADAVLALDTWSVGIPALLAARLIGARFVVRVGGDFLWEAYVGRTRDLVRLGDFYRAPRALSGKERLIRSGTRYLLSRADRIVFNSAWLEELWRGAYGFPAAHARVVGNFVPEGKESAPAEGRVFVAAGREHPLKNHELLARVFARVKEDYPDIELDTEPLPSAEHAARMRRAYAAIISSISEVNPNTAIDALRYGKPFIAPADSGAPEPVRAAGLFVDMLDEQALEKALRELLSPEGYALALARAERFSYSHPWSAVADDFLAALSV